MTLEDRIDAFRRDGFAVIRGAHSPEDLAAWQARYDAVCAREGERVWLGNALEVDPELFLPAVANPAILDFLEAVMGPFVQLDALSINAFPSVSTAEAAGKVNAWHRDRYSEVPQTKDYVAPISCNTIFYFQDLTDAFGPLRVVPGSHRQPIVFTREDRHRPRADELLLYPRAGDVVITHYQLAHSGTPNTSGKPRYFMAASYNRSWMRHADPHGPRVAARAEQARAANDRRLARLLGQDDQVWERSNPYWAFGTEGERWREWIAEDRAALAGALHNNRFIDQRGATRELRG
jgi:hypothetical protein